MRFFHFSTRRGGKLLATRIAEALRDVRVFPDEAQARRLAELRQTYERLNGPTSSREFLEALFAEQYREATIHALVEKTEAERVLELQLELNAKRLQLQELVGRDLSDWVLFCYVRLSTDLAQFQNMPPEALNRVLAKEAARL